MEIKIDNTDIDAVVENLDNYYKTNIVNSAAYKNMVERQMNFKQLNKTERLNKYYPENQAFDNQSKIWANYTKRE